MSDSLRQVFIDKSKKNAPVFVGFLTAGYPHPNLTVSLLLALESSGVDIIELGIPFTDPVADGISIQISNSVALNHKVDYDQCLTFISDARQQGLKAPVVLMGYYNPLMAYGEQASVLAAKKAGASGFIVVDLPPEEAISFRSFCSASGLSYVPLVAPNTTDSRIAFLNSIADSFLYVISRLGATGADNKVSDSLPDLISRIRQIQSASNQTPVPLAVGFGISTPEDFAHVGGLADGVVIGSKLIETLKGKEGPQAIESIKKFCEEISGTKLDPSRAIPATKENTSSTTTSIHPPPHLNGHSKFQDSLSTRFGDFGGQYVPEVLKDCLAELETCHREAMADPGFQAEFMSYYGYMNRPSGLYYAQRLSEHVGGAKIWFKREDLNHTGSHKINNAVGQILLARRLGKTRVIAETGAGQHGVATATVCAKFGMECVVYMGAEDVKRQELNVFRMKMLGAKVVAVESGSQTLKDAINEAMRDWVKNVASTHYLVGSAIGPHPFPTLVKDFQSVIGREIKEQFRAQVGKLPDAIVACVGGGSNAIGAFHAFIHDNTVRLIGVEAGGSGLDTNRHSAKLSKGTKGVLHGVMTYILQDSNGQISETHSISAGLDYPGVGPQHSFLKDIGRAEYRAATDLEALKGFRMCVEMEGIIPALETSHAVWGASQVAKTLEKDAHVVVCLSGRGDKDVEQISKQLPQFEDALNWHIS
ncbi:hypothetical protein O181_031073 [Austropuccinia psidii MF-1]|uniref:Tryptophan synthase n=1 Tax=Austropuccinia psidii MF-1 TaxID=1389203 RepID=A0A9Q3CWR3_9BASI|nr:hypothetical protein [Austropuccinia psidii MF-1]